MLTPFQLALIKVLSSIPPGKVASFGSIAEALGDRRAALAVRSECLRLRKLNVEVPWWRAVNSDGVPLKEAIPFLKREGALRGSVVERELFVDPPEKEPFLSRLRAIQEKLSERLVIGGLPDSEVAGGLDVSYSLVNGIEVAYASCVLVDERLRVVKVERFSYVPPMPYVPTYLAFREIRGMLVTARRCKPDVLFVDGQGILHPRLLGEASHVGLVAGIPSIGVAKSKLVGNLKGNKIFVGKEHRGWHFRGGFVSPGHMVGVKESLEIAKKFWLPGEKQPRPLILAHRDSKSSRRLA